MSEARAYGRLRERTNAVDVWHGRTPSPPGPDDRSPDPSAPGPPTPDAPDPDPLSPDPLSPAEARRARRLPEPAATRYAAAHRAMRRVLAGYLGVPAPALEFGRHPCPRCAHPEHGRPRLVRPVTDLEFSLSRSGPYWALAVTAGRPVGVDIETGRALDTTPAAHYALGAAEAAHVLAAAEPAHAFLRCWTRKEAVVKAVGTGIVTALRAIDVHPADPGPVRVVVPPGSGAWLVRDLRPADGVFAALAHPAAGAPGPVAVRPYPGPAAPPPSTHER
ncbi:4'-phosphopantetheinyl transferase superfamily protein [Streptomyces sp. NPDC093252]|uniref:4'-phosphopantetheinyl transferase family protein n=1 Tax=Streptomyces sp. NPDC093252 TaxID=3154980 RepID=UPI003419F263